MPPSQGSPGREEHVAVSLPGGCSVNPLSGPPACLARSATTHSFSCGLWSGLPKLVLPSESGQSPWCYKGTALAPALPVCGSGTAGTLPRLHACLGQDSTSNMVHLVSSSVSFPVFRLWGAESKVILCSQVGKLSPRQMEVSSSGDASWWGCGP